MSALETPNIQGNILIGYTYDYARHLFFRVANAQKARALLRGLELTTAYWPDGAKAPPRAINVGFTHQGLRRLGVTLDLKDEAFTQGMLARAQLLADHDLDARWSEVDVWVAIYGSRARSNGETSSVDELATSLLSRAAQKGSGLKLAHQIEAQALTRNDTRYEHFGFQDNISNPEIEGARPREKQAERLNLGTAKHDAQKKLAPICAGELVLGYEDESGTSLPEGELRDFLKNGTFAVFRQLAQDVPGFRQHMAKLSEEYGRSPDDWASLLVGRRKDGTPLSAPEIEDKWLNDFGYAEDREGARCPIGAHVRRAQPRDANGVVDGAHRIMRRGMPYGPYLPDGEHDDPTQPKQRGLCFIALNASIERQFEFVHTRWINASADTGAKNDWDPLNTARETTTMVVQGDRTTKRLPLIIKDLPRFVRCLGGAYFFVPSIPTFRSLTEPLARLGEGAS